MDITHFAECENSMHIHNQSTNMCWQLTCARLCPRLWRYRIFHHLTRPLVSSIHSPPHRSPLVLTSGDVGRVPLSLDLVWKASPGTRAPVSWSNGCEMCPRCVCISRPFLVYRRLAVRRGKWHSLLSGHMCGMRIVSSFSLMSTKPPWTSSRESLCGQLAEWVGGETRNFNENSHLVFQSLTCV